MPPLASLVDGKRSMDNDGLSRPNMDLCVEHIMHTSRWGSRSPCGGDEV